MSATGHLFQQRNFSLSFPSKANIHVTGKISKPCQTNQLEESGMKQLKKPVLLLGSTLFGLSGLTAGPSGVPATTFVVGQVTATDPRIVDLSGLYTIAEGDRSLQLAITQDPRGNLVTSATLTILGNGLSTQVGPFQLAGKLQASGKGSMRVQIAGAGVDDDQDDDGINDQADNDDDNDGVNDDVDTDDDHGGSHFASKQHGGDDGGGSGGSGGGGSDDGTTSGTGTDDNGTSAGQGGDNQGADNGSDDPSGDDDHDGIDNSHDTDDDNDGVDDSQDTDDDGDGIDDTSEHHSSTSGRPEAFRLRGTFNGSAFQVQVDLRGFGGSRSFTATITPQNSNHTLTVADAHSTQNGSSYSSTRDVTTPSGAFSSPALQQNRGGAVRFGMRSGSFGMDLRGTSDNVTFTAAPLRLRLGYGSVTVDPANVTVTGTGL
jgi:hypothetical protein